MAKDDDYDDQPESRHEPKGKRGNPNWRKK